MPVVLLIVGLVVLIAVVYAAMGRGGELSAERTDHAPLDLGPVSATDVALLRPPTAMWGYDMQATDDALEQIATSIRERDVRIVALEQLVTDLGREAAPVPLGGPFPGARHRRAVGPPTRIEPPAPAPPAWPQRPARSAPSEAPRQQPPPEPGQSEPQQQRQPPPERSHG